MKTLLVLAALFGFQLSGKAHTIGTCAVAGINDARQIESALSQFQEAVADDNRSAVAAMIEFPVGYPSANGGVSLDEDGFRRNYDEVLSPRVKGMLASQKPEDLYCSQDGVAIADGEIWFGKERGGAELRVTHFNFSKYSRAGIESMEDTEKVDTLLVKLRLAVADDDRARVASLMRYPLTVRGKNGATFIRNRTQLLRKYSLVFNITVRQKVHLLQLKDLFATNTGIGLGDGVIWIAAPTGRGPYEPKVMGIVTE